MALGSSREEDRGGYYDRERRTHTFRLHAEQQSSSDSIALHARATTLHNWSFWPRPDIGLQTEERGRCTRRVRGGLVGSR